MDKSRLVAKHKKAKEWESFLSDDVAADTLKSEIKTNLASYRTLLNSIWESNGASPALLRDLERYEQRLENLNEDLRLVVKRKIPC